MKRTVPLLLLLALLLAACAPATTAGDEPVSRACVSDSRPTVAVVSFGNTTGSRGGTHVTGMEDAATARLITLMKNSGCYDIVEQSALQGIMMEQGLESMAPEDLARAAGAGYVVTGTVTRATIAEPGATVFGVSVGATTAQVEVDVRATDMITGSVVVSMTGEGEASNPNLTLRRTPAGTISYRDPTVGPLLAQASDGAVNDVMRAIQTAF